MIMFWGSVLKMVFFFLMTFGQCILLLIYFSAFGFLISSSMPDGWNSDIVLFVYYVVIPAVLTIVLLILFRKNTEKYHQKVQQAGQWRGLSARIAAVILFLMIGYVFGSSGVREGGLMYFLCNFSLYLIVSLLSLGSTMADIFMESRAGKRGV